MLDLLVSVVAAVILYRSLHAINKMTCKTDHIPRLSIISIALAAFYAVVSPIYGEQDIAHCTFIIVGGSWLICDRRRCATKDTNCRRKETHPC